MNAAQLIKMLKVHSGIPSGIRMFQAKKRKSPNKKMKVVFLRQLPQLWGCLETVYEAALADPQVEPQILDVPEEFGQGEELPDLKKLSPDYVFLPRPYDSYLPPQYQSEELSKYTKVCYICYGYTSEGDYMLKTAFSKYFITNCYMVFAENQSVWEYCRGRLPISTRLGLRKIIKTPFPRFDLMKRYQGKEGGSWQMPHTAEGKRIMWTPRWTLDAKLGGSNFFNYKDFFFEMAEKYPENEYLIRPHPLAFVNFVKEGLMTKEQVEEYKATCEEMPNVQLDPNKEYLDSFAAGDILVSDMSGVVVDFAVTGKPVIFCSYEEEFNKANQALLEVYYIVHDRQELEETLDMLVSGKDPKKQQRQQVVQQVLGSSDGQNGKRIVELLKEDYYGKEEK